MIPYVLLTLVFTKDSKAKTLLEDKEYDRMREFLEHSRKSLPTDKDIMLCENYAANSVMSHYFSLAKEQSKVVADIKCDLPNDSGIDDVDLCVLLGNLFENAIEGCKTLPPELRKNKAHKH